MERVEFLRHAVKMEKASLLTTTISIGTRHLQPWATRQQIGSSIVEETLPSSALQATEHMTFQPRHAAVAASLQQNDWVDITVIAVATMRSITME